MIITRYNPNPHLVAPSTELRMVEDEAGEYIKTEDAIEFAILQINAALHGYHSEISLYPAGGMIYASGCEECGTKDGDVFSVQWRVKNAKNKTITDAISEILRQIGGKNENSL